MNTGAVTLLSAVSHSGHSKRGKGKPEAARVDKRLAALYSEAGSRVLPQPHNVDGPRLLRDGAHVFLY